MLAVGISAQRVGLDPAAYSGRSLRSGFLTSAAEAGIWKLSEVSRHKSLDTPVPTIGKAEPLHLSRRAVHIGLAEHLFRSSLSSGSGPLGAFESRWNRTAPVIGKTLTRKEGPFRAVRKDPMPPVECRIRLDGAAAYKEDFERAALRIIAG